MPESGLPGSISTDLFRSAWRPRKAIIILWRRVETISPEAYADLLAWARTHAADGAPWHWLERMETQEASVEAAGVLDELDRLRRRSLPAALAEAAELLRDLVWEASEPASDWLLWRPCRRCGRRWAVAPYEGVLLCPRHSTPAGLRDYLREEAERFPMLAALGAAGVGSPSPLAAPGSEPAVAANGHLPSAEIPVAHDAVTPPAAAPAESAQS